VNLSSNAVIAVDTGLSLVMTGDAAYFPLGLFRGKDLYYLSSTGTMKKATLNAGGTALTGTASSVVPSGVKDWASSSFGGSAFSTDGSRVIYYTALANAMFPVGNMSFTSTTGGTPIALNTDTKGYPGDDAYSTGGTYIFWYDAVDTTTTGIGTIHARKVDGSDQPKVIGPKGYFVRQTASDTVVAVMANSTAMGNLVTGDLLRVDLTSGNSTTVANKITYMDLVHPSSGPARVVYSRADGVYITDFQ
jgi:hypothetical protein